MTEPLTPDADRPGDPAGRDDGEPDLAFAARVARPLQEPVTLDARFETNVMAEVRAEAVAQPSVSDSSSRPQSTPLPDSRSWWLRHRSLRLSPLGSLALAASFAGLVSLGTLRLAAWGGGLSGGEGRGAGDTVQVVRFVFVDAAATQVALVGDFNGWNAVATPLASAGVPGVWAVSLPLGTGRHEYAFVVDGIRWAADAFAPRRTDEFDTESSVLTVGNGMW